MASHPNRLVFHRLEISFNFDANGFLEESAEDKFTGKSNQITSNENRILSQPELDRMALQAETYREDDAYKAKFEAKNGLVNYCFMLWFTLTEHCSRHVVVVRNRA